MLYRIRTAVAKGRFIKATAGIFQTPPMPIQAAPWTIISMVGDGDVQLYLLALKSLYSRLKRGNVTAIIAKTMSFDSRATIAAHFPGIKFAALEEIDTGKCQRGGMWERIVYMLDHAAEGYAIQMDCDTLTLREIPEVIEYAENNIPFTLSSRGEEIVGLKRSSEYALETDSDYIGIEVERNLRKYPNADRFYYVRASAAFTGFSKGGFERKNIETFHEIMKVHVGPRWKEWGSEQNASNFAIANSANAKILPYPKYANFTPDLDGGRSAFIHFFGTNRYYREYYTRRALEVIASLSSQAESKVA
jgi:uncharacterized protein (DUF433 family)